MELPLQAMAVTTLAAPCLAFALLAVLVWFKQPLGERAVTGIIGTAFLIATLASISTGVFMAAHDIERTHIPLGTWLAVGHYQWPMDLAVDRLSLPFATLGAVLVGIVGAFSRRYLHREPGFYRFYLLLALLGAGFELVVLAGSLQIVVFGWELVGVTSALLIAFFHHRPAPVRHGLRAFITYRVCDVALLTAVIWLHHLVGNTAFVEGSGSVLEPTIPGSSAQIVGVGLLLVFATMAKSAQVPLGGWLPRAMEGPTPSSAVFYGALSIHLGPYLLLRVAPFARESLAVSAAIVGVGLVTVLHSTLVGRVQTDIKSSLAYASATQVGLIYMEIGLGLHTAAMIHIIGHASIRTLQILRSPSLLHDYHHLEQAMGDLLPRTGQHLERLVPDRWQPWLYRYALERGYFDSLLRDYVGGSLARLLRGIDALEQQWCSWLGGRETPTTPVEVTDSSRVPQ